MNWPSTIIDSWAQLTELLDELGRIPSRYAFRGQANAVWPVVPSLLRLVSYASGKIDTRSCIRLEKDLLQFFQAHASLHFESRIMADTTHLLRWWSLMQHHHAPTRLLDWTDSPYIALYFAVNEQWDKDGALYLFRHDRLLARVPESFRKSNEEARFFDHEPESPVCFLFERGRKTERVAAQQGLFTVCNNPLLDHGESIRRALGKDEELYRKLVIPNTLKWDILARLRTMNLTAVALFPGGDGLGRSCQEMVRIAMWPKTTEGDAYIRSLERPSVEDEGDGPTATGATK